MDRVLWAIIVKTNANWRCQICGSAEYLQAHDPTRRHTDPRDGICLCATCHLNQHPNLPKELFLTKESRQPYWKNMSASSVAKMLRVHSRTIYRWAKKLDIPKGDITNKQIDEIRKHLHHEYHSFKQGKFLKKVYKIRKSTPTGGHEITMPPFWLENQPDINEVEVLYDSRVVIVPSPNIKVNENLLDAAFEVKY